MRFSIPLLHPISLISIYWLTSNLYPIHTQQFFTDFSHPFLYLDLTFLQILLPAFLSHIYLLTSSKTAITPLNTRYTLPIPLLHYSAILLINLSFFRIGAVKTLLFRFSQPVFTTFLHTLFLHESPTQISSLGLVLTVLGIYHFSANQFTLSPFLPIVLATILLSLRDFCITLSTPTQEHTDESTKKSAESTFSMRLYNWSLFRALPLAVLPFLWKLFRYGFHIPSIASLLRVSGLLASYHVASIALIPQIDTFTHSILATLKRIAVILFAIFEFRTPLTHARFEGLGIVFVGLVMYLIGRNRQRHGAIPLLATVFTGVVIFVAFVFYGDLEISDITTLDADGRNTQPVTVDVRQGVARMEDGRNDSGKYLIIPWNDYQSVRRSVRYTGYEQAISHDAGNVGNLVWKYATYERLTDFGNATMCESGSSSNCIEMAKTQGLSPLFFKPVANLLNPDKHNTFSGMSGSIRENDLTVLNIGLGVQMSFEQRSADPEFNSSKAITTSSRDFEHPENTKDYMRAMSESGGEMLLRGDFSLNVTRAGGFTRGHSLGCPSLFMNEDIHLGRTLETKYDAISSRRGDKDLKIAVNLKRMGVGMEKQILHFRDHYPNSRFYAQGPGDMRALSMLNVSYDRTRFFSNVEDWIEDLKEMEVSYGLRIHGNMISIAAGLPVVVVAPDWRVLELVQRMQIPHLTTFDGLFEEDVDVAKIVGSLDRFDGEEFDRNRCEIAKVYVRVFGQYGIGVRRHVREISKLC